MTATITEILGILREHGISPEDYEPPTDLPSVVGRGHPDVGEIEDRETVYATSVGEVFRPEEYEAENGIDMDDDRIREWWDGIQRIRTDELSRQEVLSKNLAIRTSEPPEPHCAWYCPIHFFGHGWGIYIRENCILSHATQIAKFVDWRLVHASPASIAQQLLRSAFYLFFLHEQFHHKVESLGFRLLISTGVDRYRPYKANVYRTTYLTAECLEESLANAESYRRLKEERYLRRIRSPIRDGVKRYLYATMPMQPPGYAEGVRYFTDTAYREGLYKLQSQSLEGRLSPAMPLSNWSIAPNMITALTDITDNIYVVIPKGARPIFHPTSIDPGATVSTSALATALTKHYGYQNVPGGKGSHVKLKKPGAQTIILPGNRPVLSPGVVKNALAALGGHPISRLPDLLDGRLRAQP
jgi:hypothetical protein